MIDVTETLSTDNENQLKDVFEINRIQKRVSNAYEFIEIR